jgi:ABC-2 type transport system ATP-binding protein
VLLNRGRLLAEGNVRQIRDLIDKHPHRIVLVSENFRALAAKVVQYEDVSGVTFVPKDRAVVVETRQPDTFYSRLPAIALEDGTMVEQVYSEDDNLEAVFNYLVKG